jgi:capsule biosynthesis phosphatase
MQGVKLIIDIDGTLCPIKSNDEEYSEIEPYAEMINRIREYKEQGTTIVLHTSRNMNTYNGNMGLINANTAKVLLEWLEKWDIPYDEIIYGKPWAGHRGLYVDDRTVRPTEFLKHSFEELEEICRESRLGGKGDEQTD